MQDVVAILLSFVAACYIVWRGWQVLGLRKKSGGCGSACGGCGGKPTEKPVVQIELPRRL